MAAPVTKFAIVFFTNGVLSKYWRNVESINLRLGLRIAIEDKTGVSNQLCLRLNLSNKDYDKETKTDTGFQF